MSFRKQQVESVLKRAISETLIRKISDPRIVGMVSITQVDVSPDLAQATVHVSVLPQQHEKTTAAGLNHAAPYIHSLVKKAVSLRSVPHLYFKLDHELKKQSAVMAAISRGVAREDARAADDADAQTDSHDDAQTGGTSRADQGQRISSDEAPSHDEDGSSPSDPTGRAGQESNK